MELDSETARRDLARLIVGFRTTQLIGVAARLGLADALRDGPRSSEELAPAVGAHAPSLRRLMRALVEIGVLVEAEEGRFGLTSMGRLLQEGAADSLRPVATLYSSTFYEAWGALLHTVRTGETALEHVFGAPLFDYLAGQPEASQAFHETMASLSAAMARPLVEAYDFARLRTIVDIGGGQGTLLAAILKAHPTMKGILFDQPAVVAEARAQFEAAGLTDRCDLIAGDFFAAVPAGGDAYLMKWIIHDWEDEEAVCILANCRQVMSEGSRLLIVETVLPDRTTAAPGGASNDINMMALTGGRERTETQYRALLAATGLHLTRIVPTEARSAFGTRLSIIESVPAGAP